jgi:arylsulfatase A-like enzyme
MDEQISTRGRHRTGPGAAVLLGATVLVGWFSLDVYVLLFAGEPVLVLDLLPATLAVIAAGAVSGPLTGGRPALAWIGVPLLAIVSKLFASGGADLPQAQLWLIRMAMLAWLATALASVLRTRLGYGALRAGLSLGALAALAQASYRLEAPREAWAFATGAVASFALGFVPRPLVRRALTLLVVALPVGLIADRIASPRPHPRPDLPPPEATAPANAPNLLIVVIDTLRADHMATYGYERVTTPGLDAFAREHATVYTQARSTSPFTLSSHASLFTGLQSVEHGSTHPSPIGRRIRADVPTLAERLREQGYQTAFIAANWLYLRPRYGLDRGFERFDSRPGGRSSVAEGFYLALAQLIGTNPEVGRTGHRSAERITDRALRWLDGRRPDPFFLALNYLDVHSPYIPIRPFDRAFSDRQPRDLLTPEEDLIPLLYDREILYTDTHVTRLLDGLKASGLFENTVVIVTSDHGEAFGERGFREHCWTLYENVLHVPLLVKPVGPRSVAVNAQRTSGAAVHDIALRELGLLEPGQSTSSVDANLIGEWYGAELAEWKPPWVDDVEQSLLTDVVAWFEGSRKVIVRSDGTVEAFDLDADPDERNPLALDAAARAAAVARAEAWWREHPPDPLESEEVDDETLEALRHLGYLGDE